MVFKMIEKVTMTFTEKGKDAMEINNNHFPLTEVSVVSTNISNLTKLELRLTYGKHHQKESRKRDTKLKRDYLAKKDELFTKVICTRCKHKVEEAKKIQPAKH